MSLDAWLKRHDNGTWSQRQPLDPPPAFRTRVAATGWEHMERLALHQLRRGVEVPSRLRWFQAIDAGWAEPDGLVCLIIPRRTIHPDTSRFLIAFASDPDEHAAQLEEHYPYRLEVFQQWPGSQSLEQSLLRACAHLQARGAWHAWSAGDIADLTVSMDLIAQAWAHRRYWFGLEGP